MYLSYFPSSDPAAKIWLETYRTNIQDLGASLGLTPAQIADEVALCDALINALAKVAITREAAASAVAAKNTAWGTELKSLKGNIARHKTQASYTEAIGNSLGIVGSQSDLDTEAYKPDLTAGLFGGFVRLKFTKKGVDGVNIYHRKKGDSTWKFLARDTKSPYDDHIELATANQPEHWEYQCFGVLDDAQIGIASDIVEIVFAG